MKTKQPNATRGNIAFFFIILLGYAIGLMIKRVHIGLILGLVIGLLASGILRTRR